MKEIWVLTIKTSLPKTCFSYDQLKMTTMAFDSYEKARTAFREKLSDLAFSKNAMFNKRGQITLLNGHISEYAISETELDCSQEEENEKFLSKERLMRLQDALTEAFGGHDTKIGLPNGYYTDACELSVRIKSGSMRLYGDHEGPCNGCQPLIYTNIFSMAKEKNYFLYINDCFGQEDDSAELYMDLIKVAVE